MTQDIENSCSLDNVVGIRCYDTSWAGIRMAITAEKGVMKFSTVEKAGLLDPHTNEHKPGRTSFSLLNITKASLVKTKIFLQLYN